MRLSLLFILFFILVNTSSAQFQVSGDATDIGNNCYNLTSNSQNQAGSFWNTSNMDLNYPFIVNFEAYFGCPFIFIDGGDGIAFVMQDIGSNLAPLGGGSLGYGGIANSIAIEFDTYSNNSVGDPSFDHVAVQQNGDINHNSSNCLVSPVPIDNNNINIEDCNNHNFTITWDPSINKLELFYNNAASGSCHSVFSYYGDIINNVFNGNSSIYWGFTGSTGSATNNQEVCIIDYENWNISINNQYLCLGDSVWVNNNYNLSNVSWFYPINNLISNNDSILISNTQSATYYYNYSDVCNSVSFDQSFDLILSDPHITENVNQHIDVSCFDYSDGQCEFSVVNGVLPYSFSSDGVNFQNDSLFVNMPSGLSQIIVLDSIGCADSIDVSFVEPLEILISLSNVLNVQCDSLLSGNIDILVSGGVAPYSFQWNGPNSYFSQSQNISGLDVGDYNLVVTDSNNCNSQIFNHTISFNNDILIDSILINNPLCFNDTNGYIDISVSGGTSPYSYQWTGPNSFFSFDEDITSLFSGSYSLLIQDVNGCVNDTVVNLDNPNPLILSATMSDVLCNGDFSGSILLNSIGGMSPYSYNWFNNMGFQSNNQNINNINANTYYLNFIDSNGCYIDTSFIISEPNPLIVTLDTLFDVSCYNYSDGFLNISASGGIQPYSFQWNGPNNFFASTLNINNLFAGVYNLILTDNNNCIYMYQQDVLENTEIEVSIINTQDISCKGDNTGFIEININGGMAPYNYNWFSSGGFQSNNQNINELYADMYNLIVIDDKLCESTFSFELFESEKVLEADILVTNSCDIGISGTAELNINGGSSPYVFNWFGEDHNNLVMGNYTVLITDNLGCEISIDYVIESNPQPEANFNVNNFIHLNEDIQFINLSTGYFNSNWNFGDGGFSEEEHPWYSYNTEGDYIITLVVSNIFDCVDSVSYNINVFDEVYIYIPNVFTPNNDGINDIFIASVINYDVFELFIYNRGGQNIFYSNNIDEGWDGTYIGSRCPLGEYVYLIKVLDIFGKEYLKKGKFLLCD